MVAYDPSVRSPSALQVQSLASVQPQLAAAPPQSSGFSFHDLLNIVNPLQHIPIVSSIYRAITGDDIKPFEKVAGDTLYGGVMGFVSSMADVVYHAITGKYFGDSVLALLTGDHGAKTTAVADASPQSATASNFAPSAVSPDAAVASPDMNALLASLSNKGFDPTLAQRAAIAYRRAVTLTTQPLPQIPALALPPLS